MTTRRDKNQIPYDVIATKKYKICVETTIDGDPHTTILTIAEYECINMIIICIDSPNNSYVECRMFRQEERGLIRKGHYTTEDDNIWYDPFESEIDSIILIKWLLTYLNEKYLIIKELLLLDEDMQEPYSTGALNMAAMNMFTDGKTIYDKHFDVRMDEISNMSCKKMIDAATEMKQKIPFDQFARYSYINNLSDLNLSKNELQYHYENSKTWQEFFSYIRNAIGKINFYEWLSSGSNWFNRFYFIILEFNILSFQYIFKPKKYDISHTII